MSAIVNPSPTSHSRPSRWPSSAASARLPPRHFASSSAAYSSRSPRRPIQNRATAIVGSSSYCSKNIHWRTRARWSSSSGTYGEPSPKYHRIAFDSARNSPSSSSRVGTRRAGFLPPRRSGRFERSKTSTSTRSYSIPRSARICRTFQQLPESCELYSRIAVRNAGSGSRLPRRDAAPQPDGVAVRVGDERDPGSAAVGEVLEQVGAGKDGLGLAVTGHDDGLVLLLDVGEDLVDQVLHLDRPERRLHRRGDVL